MSVSPVGRLGRRQQVDGDFGSEMARHPLGAEKMLSTTPLVVVFESIHYSVVDTRQSGCCSWTLLLLLLQLRLTSQHLQNHSTFTRGVVLCELSGWSDIVEKYTKSEERENEPAMLTLSKKIKCRRTPADTDLG